MEYVRTVFRHHNSPNLQIISILLYILNFEVTTTLQAKPLTLDSAKRSVPTKNGSSLFRVYFSSSHRSTIVPCSVPRFTGHVSLKFVHVYIGNPRHICRRNSRSRHGDCSSLRVPRSVPFINTPFLDRSLSSSLPFRQTMDDISIEATTTLTNGRQIPLLGLGVYRSQPGEETEKAVLWALEAGYRHIDTAYIYGNEADVGNAIRKSGIPRDQIFVTTKLWVPYLPIASFSLLLHLLTPLTSHPPTDQGFDSALRACDNSLRKLGLDYVDLYITHSPNPGPKRRKESWDAMQQLVVKGKVKSIGTTRFQPNDPPGRQPGGAPPTLRNSPPTTPLSPISTPQIHPWLTRTDIVTFCEQQNIIVEAYSPLTNGRRLSDATLVRVANKYDKTPAQVLIRWSLQRGFVVLPKSVTRERIEENADVFDFDLAEGDMDALNGLNENYTSGWDPTTAP
ncbi:LOW QUALITY PROTEIN: NADP-dependent oxidoreductase domain-containing protein [Jimgerdemannia flammicorona]|uniref:NADP-dependent oxidoreductase domain-containing protein n=1 Tax=Jimgerdemannia flammicorona TaxID=994334 RepID=A0A433Q3X1_9FUNG|nr:LOW QUALITY PROTEIN: NADP-dependent oxidoreductase domain-containing protein [Jimgerdemannia flammicorona]